VKPPLPKVYKIVAFKECCNCHETKPASEFYKNKTHNDGLAASCKDCCKDYNLKYRIAHHPGILEQKRTARKNTPNILEKEAVHRVENREQIRVWDREYHKKHRSRKTGRDNKYRKNRRHKDPIYRAFEGIKRHVNAYIKHCSIGSKNFISKQYIDPTTFDIIGPRTDVDYELDHIIPMRVGNPQILEDMKMIHLAVNFRWIPRAENGEKNDIIIWSLIEANEELLKIAEYFKLTKDDDGKRAQHLFPIIGGVFMGRNQ
jgi:hypothetical protein